jgi:hypothetical protein
MLFEKEARTGSALMLAAKIPSDSPRNVSGKSSRIYVIAKMQERR